MWSCAGCFLALNLRLIVTCHLAGLIQTVNLANGVVCGSREEYLIPCPAELNLISRITSWLD
jgi:hypothetical protein